MKSIYGAPVWCALVTSGLFVATASGQSVFHAYFDAGQLVTAPEVAPQFPPSLAAPNKTPAAHGEFYFDPQTGELSYQIVFQKVLPGTVVSADIHVGMVGTVGPRFATLDANSTGGFSGTTFPLSPAQRSALLQNHLYVSVKTSLAPAGAVRGQISTGQFQFASFLDGASVVPPVATPGLGAVNFGYSSASTQANYFVWASCDLDTIKEIHVHRGDDAENGPVLLNLNKVCPLGCHTAELSAMQLAHLRAEECYIDFHTTQFPGGEVRGRLNSSWSEYGVGCPGSLPATPKIIPFAGGFHATGGTPNGFGLLVVGTVGAQSPLGAGGCNLAVLPTAPHVFVPVVADSFGAFTSPLSSPTLTDTWVYVQFLGADPTAPLGLNATGGLGLHFPP